MCACNWDLYEKEKLLSAMVKIWQQQGSEYQVNKESRKSPQKPDSLKNRILFLLTIFSVISFSPQKLIVSLAWLCEWVCTNYESKQKEISSQKLFPPHSLLCFCWLTQTGESENETHWVWSFVFCAKGKTRNRRTQQKMVLYSIAININHLSLLLLYTVIRV